MEIGKTVFSGGIDPNDISQGELGDCYFLATCSSVAEDPDRVKDLFITQEFNVAGIYLLKLWVNGIETPVIIDDHVPTWYDKPAFSLAKSGDLWVCLIEKAWAKLLGSYGSCISGHPIWAADHLIGLPSFEVVHTNKKITSNFDKFWTKIVECDKRGYKCTATTIGHGEG